MGHESENYYDRLGVPPDASAREIRRAYRRLARHSHPDLNPGPDSAQQFAVLSDAYTVLNDPVRRARYDCTLRLSPTLAPSSRARVPPPARTRAILELSPQEAQHLAHLPLTLVGPGGRVIVLPAGLGEGDVIALLCDGRPVLLTIRRQRKT